MLAVTILGLVVAAVYTTWSTSLTAWKRGTTVMEGFQRERIVMETLQDLAQSALFFTSSPEIYQVSGVQTPGLGSTVSFVTGSTTLLPPSEQLSAGLRRVTISLRRDQHGVVYLGLANTPALADPEKEQEVQWHVLSADVIGFGVQYRNPRDSTWQDRWEEGQLIPSAMMFTVAFRGNDRDMPPLVVTRAVELAGAELALESMGEAINRQNTTNTVTQREINLSESGSAVPAGEESIGE